MPDRAETVRTDQLTETGLKTDADFWGSVVLVVGTGISKILTTLEHLEFLASAREGGFKMLAELWNSGLWWIVAAIGALWGWYRIQKRKEPHNRGPTWGLIISCVAISALFASMLTIQFSGVIPQVLAGTGYQAASSGQNTKFFGYSAQINGALLTSFKKDYKVALIVAFLDPQVDQSTDKRILVSPLFEIVPGLIPMIANKSPSGDFEVNFQVISVNYFPALVPRDVPWEKVTTIGDLLRQGGKILDPRYQ